MCHMIADSYAELIEMIDKLGIQRKWIQKEGTKYEHFDISKGKREEALRLGAIGVSSTKKLVRIIQNKDVEQIRFEYFQRKGMIAVHACPGNS